ncbi:hypothetical protein [Lacrimispora amygdalina]|uniref:hypothetical protein n=1 Tax=Lacrimispora amygdalina TaxID=253257 RepID=UPI000BE468E9|nr:hypothetical protein [Lacrimispora amygdalina]
MICIDPKMQLIEIDKDKSLRERAEDRTELYHYTSLSGLEKILEGRKLKFNNLNNFDTEHAYEREGINENFRGCIFISCMTYCTECDEMWEKFGDKKRGAKLSFKYKGAFHDTIIDKSKEIEAYSKDNILINKFGFNVSSTRSDKFTVSQNIYTDVIVDLILSDVIYKQQMPDSMINQNYLNISSVSQTVLTSYSDESETRIIGILRSVKEKYLEDISYLLAPINFNNFELEVKFGELAETSKKAKIEQLLNKL